MLPTIFSVLTVTVTASVAVQLPMVTVSVYVVVVNGSAVGLAIEAILSPFIGAHE